MASEKSHNFTERLTALFVGLLCLVATIAIVSAVVGWIRDDSSSEVSWLFSQTADSAELDDLGNGKFRLVMRGVDAHTIQFSDRPERLVEVLPTAGFVDAWDKVFATSAPNAVLVEHEPNSSTDSLVVVLTNPQFDYEKDILSYDVKILEDELHPERLKKIANAHKNPPADMRAVSLFIDNATSAKTTSSPIFTGPGANELKSRLGLDKMPTQPIELDDRITLNSATTSYDANKVLTINAVIGFIGDASPDANPFNKPFTLDMTMVVKDLTSWTLTVAAGKGSTPWTAYNFPGLTIDPSTLSGTITRADDETTFDITGAQHVWSFEDGATLISKIHLSSDCPLEGKCPSGVRGPYITMGGDLFIDSITPSQGISVSGGITPDGKWARFDAETWEEFDAQIGNVTVKDVALTLWRGNRSDSYDPNMNLPSLQKLSGGLDVELCGTFTFSIPKINNNSSSGCVRWSRDGVVIGQVGVGSTVTTSMSSGSTTASVSSDVKGMAWTNLSDASIGLLSSADAVMNGVHKKIESGSVVLAGKATLPGVVSSALGLPSANLSVDVTGKVSNSSLTMNGTVGTKINIGKEPFKLTVTSMDLSLDASSGSGATFSMGTTGTAVLGYGNNTRSLNTSVQLVAATAPNTGFALSVTARGTAAPGETADGLTASTALTKPSKAQYVWPNQFGINGLNLWNLTVQIAYTDGSPALGYTSTSYIDPKGGQTKNVIRCADANNCTETDWLVGQLGFNVSYTTPCFAYSFDSAGKGAAFIIDGGMMAAKTFKVGIAPTGCQIQSGSQQLSLPVAFAGFQFDANFGSASVSVATQVSKDGFEFSSSISNLKFAGINYTTVSLLVKITSDESSTSFTATMTSDMGDMSVKSDFTASGSNITQAMSASLNNWKWGKQGTVDIPQFSFSETLTYSSTDNCPKFDATANGSVKIAAKTYTIDQSEITFDCNGISLLNVNIWIQHTPKFDSGATKSAYLKLSYPSASDGSAYSSGTKYFYGAVGFSYSREFSKLYNSVRFRRGTTISIDLAMKVNTASPKDTVIGFSGNVSADRISGGVGCVLNASDVDFSCTANLSINPENAGKFSETWDDL